MILLWAALAHGQAPPAVVRGEDLTRWEALEALPERSSSQLIAYILDFPESRLAELAWLELRERPEAAGFGRRHRPLMQRLERSVGTHADRVERAPSHWAVGTLAVEDEAEAPEEDPSPRRGWTFGVRGGAAVDDAGLSGSLGLDVGAGAWTVLARGQVGQIPLVEGAVRLQPEAFGVGFLEVAGDSRLRGILRGGVRMPVTERFALDSSMGLGIGAEGLAAIVRLELSLAIPIAKTDRDGMASRRP